MTDTPAVSETPILPQAAAFLVISYLVYRYFFTSNSSATAAPNAAAAAQARRRVDPRRLQQQVEAVHGMFPQYTPAAIEAELIRNGGSIEIATERILSTGFLPDPPRRATPAPPAPAPAARPPPPTAASRPRPSSSVQVGPQYTDLITRYNLHDRLAEAPTEEEAAAAGPAGKGKAPASKHDRQLVHQAKRDDMILAARRRVEAMIAKERAS